MVCKKCGAQIEDMTKFCHNCGAMVEEYDQMNTQYQSYNQGNYYNQQNYSYNGRQNVGLYDTLFGNAGKKIKVIAVIYFIIFCVIGLFSFLANIGNPYLFGPSFGIFIGCIIIGYLISLSLHIVGQMAENLEKLKQHFCDKNN